MVSSNFRLKLISVTDINIKVKSFVFEFLDGFKFNYIPGQFVSLNLMTEEGVLIRRSYSIANLDDSESLLELAVTVVQEGRGTQVLCRLDIGDIVEGSGPRGRFFFNEKLSQRQIFVGTGTGIVPYRGMLLEVENFLQNPLNSCVVLQGVREEREILFERDFNRLCCYKNFDFKICLSRGEVAAEKLSNRVAGRVQDAFNYIVPNAERDTFYLCGNPYMIDEVSSILQGLGFGQERIIKEQYYAKKV